jgi:MarR family transcriptional regulator, transcriptional regulator for hemolysin
MYWPMRDDPLTKRLAFLGKEIGEAFAALLADHGCAMSTWAVLFQAHKSPGLSQVQLAAQMGIEGPTLARHLDRLCAEGLVERRRDAHDRRIARVALTAMGEHRWEELKHVRTLFDAHLIRDLTDGQVAALETAIDRIHRALEDAHVPVPADH